MISSLQTLVVPTVAVLVSITVLNLVESSRRLKLFYLIGQVATTVVVEMGLLISSVKLSDIFIHIFLAGSIITWQVFTKVFQALLLHSDTPHAVQLRVGSKIFELQVGIFDLGMLSHPSLEYLDQVMLDSSGEWLETEYAERQKLLLAQLLDEYGSIPDLEFQLIQLPSKNRVYHQFVLVGYVLFRTDMGYANQQERWSKRHVISDLQIREHRFQLIKLGERSYRTIQQSIAIDHQERLLINPARLVGSTDLHYFELGTHELDILKEPIHDHNQEQLDLADLSSHDHFLGSDLRNYPVTAPLISSVVYLGHHRKFLQFLSLPFFSGWMMICDDPDSIYALKAKYAKYANTSENLSGKGKSPIRVIDYSDICFDLIRTGIRYPKFLRLLLGLWEEIQPADSKAGGKAIAGKICEYIELQRVLSGDKIPPDMTAADLIRPSTYGQFNIDPSSDVFVKLRPVLSLHMFNSSLSPNQIPLQALADDRKNIIIDLSSTTKLEKLSLAILLLVLNDQRISSRWLAVHLVQSNLQLDRILARLSTSITLTDVFIQMTSIGDQLSWLRQFDLYLADHTMTNSRLRQSLFYPGPEESRIDLNLYGQKRTALSLE